MKRIALACVPVAALATSLAAQNPAAIEHHLRYAVKPAEAPDTALEIIDRMRYYHVPGVSLAIVDSGRVVFARGYGVTDFGGGAAVDSTTLFLAGSISKPVFTSGLLQLVERGRLSLDADVNQSLTSWHLPESQWTATEKVTLRRLLTHSAGLTVWGFPGYAIDAPIPTVAQVLDGTTPANTPAVRNDTTPGARWRYSGGGITIAQLMATDVSREPFPALMRRLVLARAGMRHSTYENPLPEALRSHAAAGHEKPDTVVPGRFHVYPEMAAAGLWTTAGDLGRWAIALSKSYRGESGGLLTPAMARQMVSKQMQQRAPFGTGWWGLGVAVSGDGDSVRFEHGGRDEGFVAQLIMWPQRGRGIAIMMNGVNGGLMDEVLRGFAEEYGLGPPRISRRIVAVPAEALGAFRGHYVSINGTDTLQLDVTPAGDGKTLAVYHSQLRRVIPLAPLGGDRFVGLQGGTEWTFLRTGTSADGDVRAVQIGAGANPRVAERQ